MKKKKGTFEKPFSIHNLIINELKPDAFQAMGQKLKNEFSFLTTHTTPGFSARPEEGE